jgi:cytochrome b561
MTSSGRYSAGAMILHWAIAIAVIANWQIAEKAEHLPEAEAYDVMVWHFQIGMTILVLTVLRIVWRLTHPRPPLGTHLKPWERFLAKAVHALFYVLLIALPLLGWIAMSGYKYAVPMFGLFEWPVLPLGFGEDTGHEILDVHASLGTAMLVLIALHVLGALKHTIFDRDDTLWKMLPFGRVRQS